MSAGRRATDWITLFIGAIVLAVASLLAAQEEVSALEEDLFRLLNDLPDWLEPVIFVPMQAGALAAVPVAAIVAWFVWRSWRPVAALSLIHI